MGIGGISGAPAFQQTHSTSSLQDQIECGNLGRAAPLDHVSDERKDFFRHTLQDMTNKLIQGDRDNGLAPVSPGMAKGLALLQIGQHPEILWPDGVPDRQDPNLSEEDRQLLSAIYDGVLSVAPEAAFGAQVSDDALTNLTAYADGLTWTLYSTPQGQQEFSEFREAFGL